MILPSAATLRLFHDAQLRRFGGAPGLRDADLLAAAVGRVENALGYAEMDATDAAAMLCHAILKSHPFVDGNKRTAYGALVMTLAGAGLRLEVADQDILDMIVAAAAGGHDWKPVAAWTRARATPASA